MGIDEEKQEPGKSLISIIIRLEVGNVILDMKDVYMLYFIEDIFSPCIGGKIQFFDKYGMIELGPFTSNETITIKFGTEKDEFENVFHIYKVGNVQQLSDYESGSMSMVELFFIDPMYYELTQKRYSIGWSNTTASDIIRSINTNLLLKYSWDKFESSVEILDNFYMPYWTPLEAIRWLMQRNSGIVSRNSGYLFYSNFRGLNFVTLDNILNKKADSKDQFKIGPTTDLNDLNKVLGWKIRGIDTLGVKKVKGGTKLGFDSATKSFKTSENTYSDGVAKHRMLGKLSLFGEMDNSSTEISLDGDSDELVLKNIFYNDFVKRYCNQLLVELTVAGRSRRYCGSLVDLYWPSSKKGDYTNKLFRGLYLVKSITHQFAARQKPTYIQKLVLMKNAYTDGDVGKKIKLVKASKRNLYGDAVTKYLTS
jgi:hypothetical protein